MAASVCIVSNEMYPVDKGGIGRLMYNFAVANSRSESAADLHFLLTSKLAGSAAEIERAFSGLATFHHCSNAPDALGPLGELIREFGARDSLDELMIESLSCYAGLLDAQQRHGREFDFVEFADFAGWGAASIATKRAGIAFCNTRFAVRLHSTFALIAHNEPFMHEPSPWMAARCDLERQCLRDADLVVAHLASTARSNAEWFRLPPEWMDKVRVEMPPILLSQSEQSALAHAQADEIRRAPPRDFLFSSRLQPFKRPDLFVRAAVRFLDDAPDSESLFRVLSYGWDDQYIDWVRRLVPARWRDRVIFLDQSTERDRSRLMLDSILVIPSDYESLCLLAFEARLLGVRTILNRRCPAFGGEPQLWREGKDCLFFDGNFISLAKTMQRALAWTAASPPPLAHDSPYWEKPADVPQSGPPHRRPPLTLAYIVYGSVNPYELASDLRELSSRGVDNIHVMVARDVLDAASLPEAALAASGIVVHVTGWIEPTAAEIQSVISELAAEAVAFLPAGIHVEREFWTLAAAQLGAQPEAALFTSHALVTNESATQRFTLNYGDAPTVAQMSDRVAHRASVFRRDTLLDLGLRDVAGDRWHEDLCIRLVDAGHRVLVAPSALVTQTVPARTSRIQSSRFFAWHRDSAAQRLGAAFRSGSVTHPMDSVVGISHEAWIVQQQEAKVALADCAKLAPPRFRFDEAVLKNASLEQGADYQELEIVLRGLAVGDGWVPWLGIKFSQYKGEPQLEFRETGNARYLFRNWPPSTSDQWGPVAVWSAGTTPHPHGEFFERLQEADARKLRLLVENLPAILDSLPFPADATARWKHAAQELSLGRKPDRPAPGATESAPNTQRHASGRLGRLGALHRLANGSVGRLAARVANRLRGMSGPGSA
jgi:glycosyltransferase involved in cell wall biosynthesis